MNGTQRQVLLTTCLTHGLIHVYELSVPALLILIQSEFGAGDFSMGRVVALYGALFGIGALPAGYLVDRFGARVLLTGCLWGASLALIGMAISPSLFWFAMCAAVMGASLSTYHPAGTALITHAIPPSGRVFALHGMAGNTGVAAASVIAGSLGALFGWRWALGLLAVPGFVVGLRALSLPQPSTHDTRSSNGAVRWLPLVLLLASAICMGMVYRGLTTFLPKFFATSYSDDLTSGAALGGALTTATLIVGLIGMYTAGRIADAGVSPAWVFLAGGAFQIPFLLSIGYAGGKVLVPLAMGVAFFHFLTQPVGNQMVAEFTPPRLRGLGYGLYFFMTFGAGAAGAVFAGWVSERVGLARTFPALAGVLVPAVVAMILLALLTGRKRERVVTPADEPGITL